MATGGNRRQVEASLRAVGLESFFDAVVTCDVSMLRALCALRQACCACCAVLLRRLAARAGSPGQAAPLFRFDDLPHLCCGRSTAASQSLHPPPPRHSLASTIGPARSTCVWMLQPSLPLPLRPRRT